MNHPCVVTLNSDSRPRALFAGDQLVFVDLPPGTRCIYPKPPLAGLKDVKAALRYALNHPLAAAPLHTQLKPGMKLTIVLYDISLPVPQMRAPDLRESVLAVVLPLCADYGVDDIEIIIATGLRRRLSGGEVQKLVGERVFKQYWPKRLYNHDAEDALGLVEVGRTERGEVIELNRRAAESDLVLCVSLNSGMTADGLTSGLLGLSSYKSLRSLYSPAVMANCQGYAVEEHSELALGLARISALLQQRLNVFNIEATLNNRSFDSAFDFLSKNEDELSSREYGALKALVSTTAKLPQLARHAIFSRLLAPYAVTGVFAGDAKAVRQETMSRCAEQYRIPLEGQADVLVAGIPYFGPYNANAFLNPLLVSLAAQGYLFNMHCGAALVKKGGTLIITHPCTDRFDHEKHAAYVEFVHRVLPETRDAAVLQQRYEEKFVANPALLEMYRSGHGYHPAHPFFVWYSGEAARAHLGRVIVVGADNEYVPKLLGYETASSMEEALYRARGDSSRSLDITCLHTPPLGLADVALKKSGNGAL